MPQHVAERGNYIQEQTTMVTKKAFGLAGGRQISAYTIKGDRLEVTVMNYGATIQSIKFDGRELVLGYDSVDGYVSTTNYFGGTIGRVANRISGSCFTLNGREYMLESNDGENFLHGGIKGYDKRVFYGEDNGEDEVMFTLLSKDGDQGMPANLIMRIVYAVEGDTLKVTYLAEATGDTYWAPTNHTFFNLSGTPSSICGTLLQINADEYTPIDQNFLPTGEIKKVEGTPFDFRTLKPIGRDLESGDKQIEYACGGYDHNFSLNDDHAAIAKDAGIRLDVYTDMPGLQLYTGNFLDNTKCRGGVYDARTAFCLEPQFFPDAVNKPDFVKPLISRGRTHIHYIKYAFSSEE